jgi:hypothetical protein
METIIHQEVVHLPRSYNLISQSQIMDKDIKVEPMNHNGLNLYNHDGKLIATAPQVDRLVVLDRVLDRESTEYTNIDDSHLLSLKTTGNVSRHNAEKRLLRHRRLAHVCLKALELLLTITDDPGMAWKCD